jgi:flagellar assembly factor FliW
MALIEPPRLNGIVPPAGARSPTETNPVRKVRPMKVQTTRFGTIDVQEDQVVTLVEGLLGFSECTRFTLFTDEIGEPFKWMQSLDNPALAFVVVDPALILPKYQFSLQRDKVAALEVEKAENLQVYVIVTMAANILDITVNLQGPVVINKANRVGMQIVLNDPSFSTRHSLFTDQPDDEKQLEEAIKQENKIASMRIAAAG